MMSLVCPFLSFECHFQVQNSCLQSFFFKENADLILIFYSTKFDSKISLDPRVLSKQ